MENYQDDIMTPSSCKYDLDATMEDNESDGVVKGILPAIAKLQKIIQSVQLSLQCCKSWYQEVEYTKMNAQDTSLALMLILDV
ncbi:hypothetical protein H2248_002436 [Termitomyces sp. 'cryptogamus']|nr:hypothetical protein H2248_002436 [Termitomyces sp. 'cryptogamus']